jgi:hypothetical protein
MPVVRRGGALECWQLEALPRLRTWRIRREPLRPCGAHAELASAWSQLAAARRDAATRQAALLVLAQTCGVHAARAVPPPSLACGPRDVRPWLDDPASVAALLHELSAPVHDPWLLTQHGIRALPGAVNWAPAFVQWLLPWLRGWSFENLRAAEQAFLALAPWHDDALTAMVCAVTTGGQPAWLRLGAQEPLARRPLFFARLLGAEAFRLAPPRDAARLFTALRHLTRAGSAERDLGFACTGLRLGAEPAHLAESLRLGRAYGWDPAPQRPADRVPCRAIGRLVRRLSSYAGGWKDRSERLWKLGCRLPGSSEILRGVARWRLSDEERRAIVYFLEDFDAEDAANARRRVRRWKTLQPRWREVLAATRLTPPTHRTKAWTLLGRLSSRLRIDAEPALLDNILAFVGRVCRPPFSPDSEAEWLAQFLFIDNETRRVLLDPAAKAWSVIEKQCACGNRAYLIGEGTASLWRAPDRFAAAALRTHAKSFVAAMSELGSLRKAARAPVWNTFAEHPSVTCDPEKMPLADAIVLLDAVAPGAAPAPLRAHADGSRLLEPHRLTHYRAALASAWTRVQIEVLRGLIERALWLGFPTASAGAVRRHTLEFAHTITKNRAPLRRLIREGHRDLRTTHPRNRDWLAAHRLAGSVWEAGDLAFARDFAAPPIAPTVVVTFENDPQTILRMGIEVGSCLALGGCNDFSAVANALDANKRVLFARDAAGRFLARQLLAISEARTLVCFPVYPVDAPAPLTEFFRLCDHTLAQALRLPLQHPGGAYAITPLVCADWYDDGVWEE